MLSDATIKVSFWIFNFIIDKPCWLRKESIFSFLPLNFHKPFIIFSFYSIFIIYTLLFGQLCLFVQMILFDYFFNQFRISFKLYPNYFIQIIIHYYFNSIIYKNILIKCPHLLFQIDFLSLDLIIQNLQFKLVIYF